MGRDYLFLTRKSKIGVLLGVCAGPCLFFVSGLASSSRLALSLLWVGPCLFFASAPLSCCCPAFLLLPRFSCCCCAFWLARRFFPSALRFLAGGYRGVAVGCLGAAGGRRAVSAAVDLLSACAEARTSAVESLLPSAVESLLPSAVGASSTVGGAAGGRRTVVAVCRGVSRKAPTPRVP